MYVVIIFLIVAVIICLTAYIDAYYEVKKWRAMENNQAKVVYMLRNELESTRRRPMETVSADIARTITELQNENAQLRGDVETGCRLIDKQREMLETQTKLLNRITAEKKAPGRTFRRRYT